MPVIAVTNYKGGVGKTTTALNLAAAFQKSGKQVLVVDFDPQANLTIHAGFKDVDALGPTLSEVMLAQGHGQSVSAFAAEDVLRHMPSGLDLLPCNHRLVLVEQEFARIDGGERILKGLLAELRNRYDFVVIDCLPGAGLLSTNALTAADYALVPVQAEYLAMQGLAYLLQYVAQVRASYNPRLQILGVLMTMVDLRTLHSREVLEAIRQVFQTQIRVFYSMVKVDVKIRESSKAGQTILDYAPSSKAAEAYRSLGEEILAILPDYEEDPTRGTLADPDLVASVADAATNLELEAISNGHTLLPADDQAITLAEPVAEDGVVTAADSPPVVAAVACPRLGFASRPDEHSMDPHADHFCFAMREPLTLGLNRQRMFCLSEDHRQCPLFMRYSLMAMEESRKQQSDASGSSLKRRLFGGFRLRKR